MATIEVSHKTTMNSSEFREAIDQAFSTISEMYKISGSWDSATLYLISGANIEGGVELIGNRVEVSLKLGILLLPFASTIESMIKTALKDRLK